MKKQLLTACGILLATFTFSQETFFTNNFSKKVEELNTSMKTVEFKTVLPSDYTKYDDIVAVIDAKDVGLDDMYTLNFYYNILPVKNVPTDGSVKYIVESGSDKRSDFTSIYRTDMDVDFEVFHSLGYEARSYRYQTVVVKVMGRKQAGMHWVNEEYVPKYNYEKLSLTEIRLDLGEPKLDFTTEKGLFTYKKYTDGLALTKIYNDSESDNLKIYYEYGEETLTEVAFSIYEVEAGQIKQESANMSGGGT
jgi:hypothetical protein